MKTNLTWAKDKKIYNPNKYSVLDAGICCILVTLIFFGVGQFVGWILPKTGKFYDYIKSDYGFNVLISIIIAQAVVFAVTFTYSRIRKVSYLSGGGYCFKFDAVNTSFACLMVLGIYLVFENLHMDIANNFGVLFPEPDIDTDGNTAWVVIVNLVLSPLLPAIIEEGFLRGIIYRSLESYGRWFAIITSALIFALFHGNPQQLFLQFLGGVAFAFVLSLTKNFFIPCFMHFFYNLFIIFVESTKLMAEEHSAKFLATIEIFLPFLGIVCLIIGVAYFANLAVKQKQVKIKIKNRSVFLFDKENNILIEKDATDTIGVEQELANGKYFLHGNEFILPNKQKNKLAGIVLTILAISLCVIDVCLSVIL